MGARVCGCAGWISSCGCVENKPHSAPPSVRSLSRVEDSIDGSWVFIISKKVKVFPSHSLATNLCVLAVVAFTFCVGLAWFVVSPPYTPIAGPAKNSIARVSRSGSSRGEAQSRQPFANNLRRSQDPCRHSSDHVGDLGRGVVAQDEVQANR